MLGRGEVTIEASILEIIFLPFLLSNGFSWQASAARRELQMLSLLTDPEGSAHRQRCLPRKVNYTLGRCLRRSDTIFIINFHRKRQIEVTFFVVEEQPISKVYD